MEHEPWTFIPSAPAVVSPVISRGGILLWQVTWGTVQDGKGTWGWNQSFWTKRGAMKFALGLPRLLSN